MGDGVTQRVQRFSQNSFKVADILPKRNIGYRILFDGIQQGFVLEQAQRHELGPHFMDTLMDARIVQV